MEKDYRDKIKKLLALAESDNKNEAKAALLKARQLMAEHKLCERDVMDAGKAKVVRGMSGITCSKRRDSWIIPLSAIIGEAYCCQSFRSHRSGKQTNEVGFVGLEDDYEVCMMVFKYAVECVNAHNKEIQKRYGERHDGAFIRKMCESYGLGFVEGICTMFDRQTAEQNTEYSLVLSVPHEVTEACTDMQEGKAFAEPKDFGSAEELVEALKGEADGEKFDPNKRLAAAE